MGVLSRQRFGVLNTGSNTNSHRPLKPMAACVVNILAILQSPLRLLKHRRRRNQDRPGRRSLHKVRSRHG